MLVVTRWASIATCLQSLQNNKKILKALAINDAYQDLLEQRITNNILDEHKFWNKIERFLKILFPLESGLQSYTDTTTKISDVTAFHDIDEILKKELPSSPLLKIEENKVLKEVEDTNNLC